MKKKIIIYGAYGLVGSNICKMLEKDYPDIDILKIKGAPSGIIAHEAYDYVIYGTGYGQPTKFTDNKIETFDINSVTKISWAFSHLKKGGKFMFISSSEIYSGAPSPHKETDIGTTTPQHPRACYIEGKRCGEAICMAYKEQGYDVKIARLALAYGPGTKKGDTRVLNQFIEQALTKGSIWLRDKGESIRTYCYVEDAVEQMLNILFKGNDCVYNVGGKSTVTIYNLAKTIAAITLSKFYCGEVSDSSAPEDVRLDMTKTLTEFPMTLTDLEIGLMKTIQYQKELYGIK